jgi:nitrate reductase NapAB chaperone NapD
MPIKSYLIFPKDGHAVGVIKKLTQFTHCEVMPADNQEVIVLVTDCDSEKEDEQFLETLKGDSTIQHISLISGFST